jgi:undecaprenyl diphosphate synthase
MSTFSSEARGIVKRTRLRHIGFIVDGNRRWAIGQNLPSIEGHRRALQVLLDRVGDGADIGLSVMSFWLFSTENWRRGDQQVSAMFNLGREIETRLRAELVRLRLRFRQVGRRDRIPHDLRCLLSELERDTQAFDGPTVIAAIDYGGRDEVVRAVNAAIATGIKKFTPETLNHFLDTTDLPDPDLIIRTSGEVRTSGYMVWQAAHSEWFFTNTLFPALDRDEFLAALRAFDARERRYGG